MKAYELISKLMEVPAGTDIVGCVDGSLNTECREAFLDDCNFVIELCDPECLGENGGGVGTVTELIEFYQENS